jgi:hypothetical protein
MRGTVATNLAAAGCSAIWIADVVGWSLEKCQKIVDTYIARSGRNADAAFAALEAHKVKQAQLAAVKTNETVKKMAANSNEPVSTQTKEIDSARSFLACHRPFPGFRR